MNLYQEIAADILGMYFRFVEENDEYFYYTGNILNMAKTEALIKNGYVFHIFSNTDKEITVGIRK